MADSLARDKWKDQILPTQSHQATKMLKLLGAFVPLCESSP